MEQKYKKEVIDKNTKYVLQDFEDGSPILINTKERYTFKEFVKFDIIIDSEEDITSNAAVFSLVMNHANDQQNKNETEKIMLIQYNIKIQGIEEKLVFDMNFDFDHNGEWSFDRRFKVQ